MVSQSSLFAEGLDQPRTLRVAPNGDIFVAETASGNVRVLRPSTDGSAVAKITTYARDLSTPFGIAFYPAGPDPKWVYVAEENRVIRFSYSNGDPAPRSAPEIVVAKLASTTGGHVTRNVSIFGVEHVRLGSLRIQRCGRHAKKEPARDKNVGSRARCRSSFGTMKRAGPMS